MLGKYDNEAENILFCNDLYNHKGLDIVKYLSLQSSVIKEQPKSDYAADKQLIAKIFIQQDIEGENYSEKVNKLLNEKQINSTSNNNAKLRSMLEIQELYNYIFGHKPKDLEELKQLVNETIAKKVVRDMIYCVANQAEVEVEYKTAVAKWLEESGYKKVDTQITICEQILLEYEISPDEAKQVVQKLISHYNKNIRKKEADK